MDWEEGVIAGVVKGRIALTTGREFINIKQSQQSFTGTVSCELPTLDEWVHVIICQY